MIINSATLAAAFQSFQTLFNQAFQGVSPRWQKVAMRVPSLTKEEIYAWLNAFPKMREWIGDRVLRNLSTSDMKITNKDWEVTVEVDRNDIEDDRLGIYSPIIQQMGQSSGEQPDELVFALLALGFTTAGYDGQYFFDTDHPVAGASVSNYGGGAGTAWYLLDATRAIKPLVFQDRKPVQFVQMTKADDEVVFMSKKYRYGADSRNNAGFGLWQLAYASKDTLNAANYAAARAAMMGFKNDEGKPLGIRPSLLVVPPSLEGAARALLMMQKDATGADNPWYNTAELEVCPWLS